MKAKCPKCGEIIMITKDELNYNADVYCKNAHYFNARKLIKGNAMRTINGVKIMETILKGHPAKAIDVINICDWMDFTYGDDRNWADYETSGDALLKWCKKNDCTYYAAPRECFSIMKAVNSAYDNGFKAVVVEDLS